MMNSNIILQTLVSREEFLADITLEKMKQLITNLGWRFKEKWGISYLVYIKNIAVSEYYEFRLPVNSSVSGWEDDIYRIFKQLAGIEDIKTYDLYQMIKNTEVQNG